MSTGWLVLFVLLLVAGLLLVLVGVWLLVVRALRRRSARLVARRLHDRGRSEGMPVRGPGAAS
jgi:hypothetical protein